jgi:hypothetical protein
VALLQRAAQLLLVKLKLGKLRFDLAELRLALLDALAGLDQSRVDALALGLELLQVRFSRSSWRAFSASSRLRVSSALGVLCARADSAAAIMANAASRIRTVLIAEWVTLSLDPPI